MNLLRRLAFGTITVLLVVPTLSLGTGWAASVPPYNNDDFASGLVVSADLGQVTGASNVGSTSQVSEPATCSDGCNGLTDGPNRTVWFRWTPPYDGAVTFDTCAAATFDTMMAAYYGALGSATNPLVKVADNDDASDGSLGCDKSSLIYFPVVTTRTYKIQVDGYQGATGTFTLTWKMNIPPPANDNIVNATLLSNTSTGGLRNTNYGATVENGEPAICSMTCATGTYNTIWFKWVATGTRWFSFDTCLNTTVDTVMAIYSGQSSPQTKIADNEDAPTDQDCGDGTQSFIAFSATLNATYWIQVGSGLEDQTGSFRVGWQTFTPPPANDNIANATVLSGVSGSTTGTNAVSSTEQGEPATCSITCQIGPNRTVWYRWTAPQTGQAIFDTCTSTSLDTLMGAYQGTSYPLTKLTDDDDGCTAANSLQSRVVFNATSGVTYSIQVDSLFADTTGPFTLKWAMNMRLNLTKAGTGTGSVTSSPAGISCGATCGAYYAYNTSVTLTSTPDTYSNFAGWSGDCSGTSTCSVTMSQARNVTATYTLKNYTLSVSKSGTGGGTITSSPGTINCGGTCSGSFAYGTVVTLTATADGTSAFTGWGGACSGSGTCQVTMAQASSVTATFTSTTLSLVVGKAGTGSGTVTSSPAGINCGVTCSYNYNNGTSVVLTATADASSTFTGWSGGCSGTSTCTVIVGTTAAVTANFAIKTPLLTVSRTGTGTGSVASSPAGISCPATCSSNYTYNTLVTLTPSADISSNFTGWSGDCTGTGTCQVTMTQARNVTATFTLKRPLLTVSSVGAGTVTSSPAGISCAAATCTANYDYNTTVTLTASQTSSQSVSSSFTGWTGDCTGSGTTCQVTMTQARTVSAKFSIKVFTLSVSLAGTGTGTVTSTPTGVSCPGACLASYDYGTTVTLAASAASTSFFANWGGACTGTGTCSVTMTANQSVSATFTLKVFQPDGSIAKTSSGTYLGVGVYNNTGTNQTQSYTIASGKTANFFVNFKNTGNRADTFTMLGTGGGTAFVIKYFLGTTDITTAVVAGTYTKSVAIGASFTIKIAVTVKTTTKGTSKTVLLTGKSAGDTLKADTVKGVVTVG